MYHERIENMERGSECCGLRVSGTEVYGVLFFWNGNGYSPVGTMGAGIFRTQELSRFARNEDSVRQVAAQVYQCRVPQRIWSSLRRKMYSAQADRLQVALRMEKTFCARKKFRVSKTNAC